MWSCGLRRVNKLYHKVAEDSKDSGLGEKILGCGRSEVIQGVEGMEIVELEEAQACEFERNRNGA